MKAHTKLFLFALPILFAFNLAAAALDPWDTMLGTHSGVITITPNSGKQVQGHGNVFFAADVVTFAGVSYLRANVKEVVIRRERESCCDALAWGVAPLLILGQTIIDHDLPRDSLPYVIIFSPVIVAAAAITGLPLLVIEGIRRLLPDPVAYRVVP